MKRLTLIIASFAIAISLFSQIRHISVDDAQVIANRNAAIKWGNVSPAEPIIYYSADDQILAYRFNYAINKTFPDRNTVFQECNEGKQNGNRKAQWGNGNYGNILMSARTDMPVNLEHGLGISSEFAYHEYLQEQAEAHLGSNYSLERIYYINAVNVWHHYTNGSKDIYIKAHAPAKVGDYEVFQTAVSESTFFCETDDYNDQWDQYLFGEKDMSKSPDEMIPLHDECCPFYDWSYGCTPTAAAMLLAYWDHRSMYYPYDSYSRLVNYHFERADTFLEPPGHGGSCEIDTHCPNVMEELAIAMNTNWETGGTLRPSITPGYQYVTNTMNGYSFTYTYHHDYSTTFYFDVVMIEIDSDCPLHISIAGHSVLGVGYNLDDEEIITHYTHQPWLVNITKAQLQAVYQIIPGGQFGNGIEIISPDGDQDYLGLGSGKTFYAGDVCEISWNHVYAAGSYVKLLYSTNHGVDWTTIISNTPNDGVYDWVIPAGINSNACRIQIFMYSSDGMTVLGGDGSYGDFQINSGGSIYTLFSESKVTTITNPDYYQFSHPYGTWCAVGVRPNVTAEDWNIEMFSNQSFSTKLVTSDCDDPVDFIVVDRHHYVSSTRGIKTSLISGSNMASVEFEGDQETLSIGTNGSYGWTAGDVVEMYDVYLTPGVYAFDLDIISGTANLDFALFGSTDAVYYKNRESFLAHSTNTGTADENFSIAITTSDYYGLCVWANDGNSSTYNIDIHDPDPGTWDGDNSVYWADPYNWSFNTLPTPSTDITIPAGTPNSCVLSYGNITCNSLIVYSGAVLNIDGHTLTIDDDMTIDGSIGLLHENSIIDIYGDVEWNAGSTLNFSYNDARINVYGNWNFNEGANVNPGLGNVDFRGTSTKYIRCFSKNCSFYKLRNYKSGGASLGLSAQSTEQLVVEMLTYLNTGTNFIGYSSFGMLMKGSFNYYGTFDFNTGSVTFDGTDIRQFSAGSGTFNNVIFNSTTGSQLIDGDMTVTGDLTIEQGYFSPGANTVFVARDWTNNVGTGGFIPGTGRVIFNGGNYHQYCSSETFNELEIDKPLGGAFRMNGTNVECEAYDWTAGAVDVLSGSFTANDLLDNGITGAFYNNTGGTINLTNSGSGTYVDLNGEIHIFGGTMTVTGSISDWPFANNALIEMSGGVLDFTDCGISIVNNGYTLTENITGGVIRTSEHFSSYRPDFTPSAGTFEFYGGDIDYNLYQISGSTLYNVNIDKSAKGTTSSPETNGLSIDKRSSKIISDGGKSNTINLTSDLHVTNDLTISNGSMVIGSYTATIDGNCNINGLLDVGTTGNVINHGLFDQGSSGTLNITGGSFVNDHPSGTDAWQYLNGTLNLSAGLFEIEHNSIYLGSTFNDNITGGTMRTGYSLSANYAGTFEPSGGIFEFTSTESGPFILCNATAGNYFNDIDINSSVDIVLLANTEVKGNTIIDNVMLSINSNDLSCLGNVNIYSGGTLNLNNNATLKLDDGSALTVAAGGEMELIGALGNEATLTHISSGVYSCNIFGTIAAQHAIFEHMSASGINVRVGGIVDPTYTFNNCAFQNGAPAPSALLSLHHDQTYTCENVYFENTNGNTGYNVWKYEDDGNFTFIDASGDFEGENFDYDPYNHVDWSYISRTVDLTVFMEGPFNLSSNIMNTDINNIVPLNQPFDDPPLSNPTPDWYYTGSENVGVIPNTSIVDWILVELRDATSIATALPGTTISTQAAFLTNTGNIVGLDGVSPLTFTGTITNSLYAVIWTRNHLGVISANPLSDVGGIYSYDFSSGSGQAYGGTGSQRQLSSSPAIWGLISGDGNGTGLIAPGDKSNVWTLQAGEAAYLESDYNLDGQVDNLDKDDYWLPNNGAYSLIPE